MCQAVPHCQDLTTCSALLLGAIYWMDILDGLDTRGNSHKLQFGKE